MAGAGAGATAMHWGACGQMASADAQKIQLIMSLRSQGIRSTAVLEALERVPRELFVDPHYAAEAYVDKALPIDCGQTISQPYIVAFMTEKLEVDRRHKVLEVGTGSGYQTCILSQLCRRVYTIERYRPLLRKAEERFRRLRFSNVTTLLGDGLKGWESQAPFDRIILTAAASSVPVQLLDQLRDGGIMVLPIETFPGRQELQRIIRTDNGFERESLLPVRFVPLQPGLPRDA